MSKLFIDNARNFRDRRTDKVYQVIPQMVDLNCNDKYVLRYNIGINGYNEWTCINCEYDSNEFNKNYEAVTWGQKSKKWIPTSEYKFWEEEVEDCDDEEYDSDEESRSCSDCPDDECTGHCMSCSYRPV